VKIDLSSLHRLVTENHGDHGSVDAIVQKRHRSGVSTMPNSRPLHFPQKSARFLDAILLHRALADLDHQPLAHWGLRAKAG
jgi:hypothetical protein